MLPGTNGEFASMAAVLERGALSLSDVDDDHAESLDVVISQSEIDLMRARMLSEESQGSIDHAMLTRISHEQRCEYARLIPDAVVRDEILKRRQIMVDAKARIRTRRAKKSASAQHRSDACLADDRLDHSLDSRQSRRRISYGPGYTQPLPATSPASAFKQTTHSYYRHVPSRIEMDAVHRMHSSSVAENHNARKYLNDKTTRQMSADFGIREDDDNDLEGKHLPEERRSHGAAAVADVEEVGGSEVSKSAAHVRATSSQRQNQSDRKSAIAVKPGLVIAIVVAVLMLVGILMILFKFKKAKRDVHRYVNEPVTPYHVMTNPLLDVTNSLVRNARSSASFAPTSTAVRVVSSGVPGHSTAIGSTSVLSSARRAVSISTHKEHAKRYDKAAVIERRHSSDLPSGALVTAI